MTEKRHDIQGLRAWAVIAVVIFHFFPSLLPFGYLGVDVFFVLSGYLISLVLDNRAVYAISTYTNFYFKRIRRIFPLLLMIVFFSSVYSVFCYSDMLFLYSEKSALRAILFITNLKGNSEGEDYFRDLEHAGDLYTHTWSLSVEIQFYLLAPLLLHIMKPSCANSFYTIPYLLAIACCSYIYSELFTSYPFYSTIARLWQFTAGAIAFRLQKVQEIKEQQIPTTIESLKEEQLPVITELSGKFNNFKIISDNLEIVDCCVVAVIMLFCNAVLDGCESVLRSAITFSAASLLVLKLRTPLLTHRSLQIIGDSSYALYLIHWPVVCVLRYNDIDHWTFRLISMILCFAASILVYEIYEKWYMTLSEKWTIALIGGLYLASVLVYVAYLLTHTEVTELGDIDSPRTYEEARIHNQYMDSRWDKYLELKDCSLRDPSVDRNPWGFCNLPPGNGGLSFLIIGNSYAANHGRLIVDNLKEHYGRIAVHTVSECEPLIETKSYYCPDTAKLQEGFLKDIETYKPDVLFISARYIDPNVTIDAQNITDDSLYKRMMEKFKKYEKNVKKVFILHALPRTANLQNEGKREGIREGKPIEAFMEETIETYSIPMRRRVEEMAKNCEKCVVYDLLQMHLLNGQFMTSNPDTHLHYFESSRHHTPVGLKLVEPLYRKLSENFDDLMKSNSTNNVLRWND